MCICYLLIAFLMISTLPAAAPRELNLYEGIPSTIPCSKAVNIFAQPKRTATVECRITKNNQVLFLRNITWSEKTWTGAEITVDRSWNGLLISVSAKWGSKDKSRDYTVNVIVPTAARCNGTGEDTLVTETGKSPQFACPVPDTMRKNFTEKELQEYHVTWFRNCDAISSDGWNYIYVDEGKSGPISHFPSLKIVSSALSDSGSTYRCAVKYNNTAYDIYRLRLKVTLEDGYVAPELLRDSPYRTVSKGENTNIRCFWRSTDTNTNVRNAWSKGERRICQEDKAPCSLEQKTEVTPDGKRHFFVTSTLTISNIDESDAGTYTCRLWTAMGQLKTNVSIAILPEKQVAASMIAIWIVLSFLIVGLLLASCYIYKKIEITYIYHRKFKKHFMTEKPITYLIYGDDSYIIDNDRDAVQDVTNWLKTRGVKYWDQSDGNGCSDTGAPIADRSISLMQESLSLTIFLTPSLLNNNTLELFKTYSGFEDNVIRKEFPIIFVCTREFQIRIQKFAKYGENMNEDELKIDIPQETYRTFSKFMRRNKVVHWCPSDKVQFFRALYIALPKVTEKK